MKLNNIQIIVTRPQPQANELCKLIEAKNIKVICSPLIQIKAINIKQNILFPLDMLIFISRNAVKYAQSWLRQINLKSLKIVAIGQATKQALAECNIPVDIQATPPYTSESLLNHADLKQIKSTRVLIIKGENGRKKLKDELMKRGAIVQTINVYQRELIPPNNAQILNAIKQKKILVTVISSQQILNHYYQTIFKPYIVQINIHILIVNSQRLKEAAVLLGFEKVKVAKSAANKDIMKSILSEII